MAVDTSGIDRALGAIGTTFRLVRLYPSTHPAVLESLKHVAAALPALAAMGTMEWTVGATGLHWHGRHILARNHQVAELAGLLYARGVRAIHVDPGLTPEHILALLRAATGSVALDDPALGRVTLLGGRRAGQRPVDAVRSSSHAMSAASAPAGPREAPDVEARRVLAALRTATTAEAQREGVERLRALAAGLLALHDAVAVAEVIADLDRLLVRVADPTVAEAIGPVAATLAEPGTVERMVARLGEARVPPAEREILVRAVGALAAITAPRLVDALLAAPADLREPYRAAIRAAADRAIEALEPRLAEKRDDVVAVAAQFLGLAGSPTAVPLLVPLLKHRAEAVREAALLALAEIGGREISRPAIPPLEDASAIVRAAAAKAVGVGGDASATAVLIRRLDQEEDEGVLAELLRALGRLGSREGLEVLARYAEPGGRPRRRTPYVRAAAIEGLAQVASSEARALLELYRQDKDPAVKRAAEAVLK